MESKGRKLLGVVLHATQYDVLVANYDPDNRGCLRLVSVAINDGQMRMVSIPPASQRELVRFINNHLDDLVSTPLTEVRKLCMGEGEE